MRLRFGLFVSCCAWIRPYVIHMPCLDLSKNCYAWINLFGLICARICLYCLIFYMLLCFARFSVFIFYMLLCFHFLHAVMFSFSMCCYVLPGFQMFEVSDKIGEGGYAKIFLIEQTDDSFDSSTSMMLTHSGKEQLAIKVDCTIHLVVFYLSI